MRLRAMVTAGVLLVGGGLLSGCYVAPYDPYYGYAPSYGYGYPGYYGPSVNLYYNGGYYGRPYYRRR